MASKANSSRIPFLKKIKRSDSISLDPLKKIDQHLQELYLQHLSGNDLLKLSEVSRQWNRQTANNGNSKLRLAITENWHKEFDIEAVTSSERKYESIQVNKLLRRRDQVFQLFVHLAEFLVSIDTAFDIDMKGIQLKHVSKLVLRPETPRSFVESGLLDSVVNLRSLHIGNRSPFPGKILECLKSNPHLEQLTLEDEIAGQIFNCSLLGIEFKLKTLKINNTYLSNHANENFFKFLHTQAETLTELKLLNCNPAILNSIFKVLPNLRCFTFGANKTLAYGRLFIEAQPKLEDLRLVLVPRPMTLMILQIFLTHLKKLYIDGPTLELMSKIIKRFPCLEEFSYAFILSDETRDEIQEQVDILQETTKIVIRQI